MNAVFVNYPTAADLVIFDIHANFKEKYKSVIIYIISSHNTNVYIQYTCAKAILAKQWNLFMFCAHRDVWTSYRCRWCAKAILAKQWNIKLYIIHYTFHYNSDPRCIVDQEPIKRDEVSNDMYK